MDKAEEKIKDAHEKLRQDIHEYLEKGKEN